MQDPVSAQPTTSSKGVLSYGYIYLERRADESRFD